MKKLFSFILILCLLISTNVSANKEINVYIDNTQISFDVPPQLIGGRTMVPLRKIFEELGATVLWEQETQTVIAYNEAKFVKATIDSNDMYINGVKNVMDIAPMVIDNRTLIPARFVAEAFDCIVKWDADRMAVYITSVPIDYKNLEQDTIIDNHEKNDYDIDYYDCKLPFPKYDSIIDTEFIETIFEDNVTIYIYEKTTIDDISLYISHLVDNENWRVSRTEKSQTSSTLIIYLKRNSNVISIVTNSDLNEVWVAIID